MISCTDFIAGLGNYLEGDVAAEVRRQLESHLAHCRTCQVVYDSTRKTLQIVTESGSFDLPEAASKPIVAKVMDKIRGGYGGAL
jgi:putative zinc finger protein